MFKRFLKKILFKFGYKVSKIESKETLYDILIYFYPEGLSTRIAVNKDGVLNGGLSPSKLQYEIEIDQTQHTLGSLAGKSAPTKRKSNVKNLDDIL